MQLLPSPTKAEVAHKGHSLLWLRDCFFIATLIHIPAACASTDKVSSTSSREEPLCNPISASLFASVIWFSGKLRAYRISPKMKLGGFGHSTAVRRDDKFLRKVTLAQMSVSSGWVPSTKYKFCSILMDISKKYAQLRRKCHAEYYHRTSTHAFVGKSAA